MPGQPTPGHGESTLATSARPRMSRLHGLPLALIRHGHQVALPPAISVDGRRATLRSSCRPETAWQVRPGSAVE